MRRFFALLVALALTLCQVCACAEDQSPTVQAEAPEGWRLSNDVTVDPERFDALLRDLHLFGPARRTVELCGNLLNALEPSLTVVEGGLQIDLDLNGVNALSLGGAQTQDGVAIAGTLLPSYVITVPTEKIMSIVSAIAPMVTPSKTEPKAADDAPAPEETSDAGAAALPDRQSDAWAQAHPLLALLARYIVTEAAETGVFQVNGVTYDLRQPYALSPEGIVGAWHALVDLVFGNEGFATLLDIAKNVGLKITPEQVKALLPTDRLPRIGATVYAHSLSGGYCITAIASSGDGTEVWGEAQLELAEDAVTGFLQSTTLDLAADFEMRRDDGTRTVLDVRRKEPLLHVEYTEDDDALRGHISLPAMRYEGEFALTRTDGGLNGRLSANVAGAFYGAAFEAGPYDESGDGLMFTATLHYGDAARPLFQETLTLQPRATLTLDFTDQKKRLVPITALVTGKNGYLAGITVDLLVNGLGGLLKTVGATVPELLPTGKAPARQNP